MKWTIPATLAVVAALLKGGMKVFIVFKPCQILELRENAFEDAVRVFGLKPTAQLRICDRVRVHKLGRISGSKIVSQV